MRLIFQMKITIILSVVLLGLSGCFSANSAVTDQSADLRGYRRIYVQSSQNDSNHVDQMLANELVRLGYDASAGVRTMMPDNAQIYMTYQTQWNWDFRTYLIQLDFSVRDVRTEKQLGNGLAFHSGVTSKSPEKMVAEALKPMFGPKK